MKVLQVIPTLVKGGAERVVIELCNSLQVRGHEVECLLLYEVDSDLNSNNIKKSIPIHSILRKQNRKITSLVCAFNWIFVRRRQLVSFDVIHCHLTFGLLFGSLIKILTSVSRRKIPTLVFTWHFVGIRVSLMTKIMHFLGSIYFDCIVFMAENKFVKKRLKTSSRRKYLIIENGISQVKRTRQNRSHDIPSVGTISRLVPERRPLEVMETLIAVAELNNDMKVVVGGEGPALSGLMELVEKHQRQNQVEFRGLVKDSENFLQGIDFYVTLSIGDVIGISGLEAVSMGIPTYGLEISKNSSIVPNWFYSSDTPTNIAKLITFHRNNPFELLDYINRQSEEFHRRFTADVMTNCYLTLYTENS